MKKIILSMFLLGTLLNANAQVPSYVPSNGLKGWWPFSGTINDESGNGNAGGGANVTFKNDRFGNSNSSVSYDGIYTRIDLARGTLHDMPVFTYATWVNLSSMSKDFWGINKYVKWLKVKTDGTIEADVSATTTHAKSISNSTLSPNTWYHVVITYNDNNDRKIHIYLNGVEVTYSTQSVAVGSLNPDNTYSMAIGYYASYLNDGQMDDAGIWNRALTSMEITGLYEGCKLSISTEPSNQTANINSQAQFVAKSNTNSATHQWQMDLGTGFQNLSNAGQYSGAQNDTLLVSNVTMQNNNQNFRCIVKSGTCIDTSKIAVLKVFDNVGLENTNIELIKVFPVPTTTQVIIDNGNFSTMGSYTAKIVNSIGQQVFQSVINQQQFVIDANTMSGAGVYTLYITDANNKVVGVKKIVLQ
jgi:hypothetical protein